MNYKTTPKELGAIAVLIATLLSFQAVRGQTGAVTGTILLEDSEPAAGATVVLADSKLGAAAGADGSFLIGSVPPGSYNIDVRLVGYAQDENETVVVRANDTSNVTIVLRLSAVEMNPVVVTGSRRQDAKDTRSSITTIAPRETKFLPGAAEDVMRSLQALPGVTSVSDFSSQLVVRGSGPDQNLVMIDGFEVLNPYRLYGFVSMFNPETINDISLQTGGFAAQYGDRFCPVLDVRNRDDRADRYFGG